MLQFLEDEEGNGAPEGGSPRPTAPCRDSPVNCFGKVFVIPFFFVHYGAFTGVHGRTGVSLSCTSS